MPDRYVLDAHAWVEYLRGSPPGNRVRQIMEHGVLYTNSLTLAEVVGHIAKAGEDADLAARAVQTLSDVVELDNELSIRTAKRFARMRKTQRRATFNQAYLIETAKKVGAEIVSGDKNMVSGRAILIK